MKENFEVSLALLLDDEGGFSNHPMDPGGMTNLGVTKRAWEAWKKRPVTEEEMQELTPEKVAPFYKEMYWDLARCDDLPDGVDYCVFDLAVNSGVSRAVKTLQECLGVVADGKIGPKTLAAMAAADPKKLTEGIIEKRLLFLQSLVAWGTFGRGWGKRVVSVRRHALGMLGMLKG